MGHQTFASRSIHVFVAVAVLLLVVAAPALAADGMPVFQSAAFGTRFDDVSQIQPDAYEKFVAFVATPLPDGGPTNDSRVWVVNFQTAETWAVNGGAYPSPVPGPQAHPTVIATDGLVRVVYEQATTSSGDIDLWIWEGDEHGVAAAGFPKALVTGTAGSHQTLPSLGAVTFGDGDHVYLAWQDDRINGPLAPSACETDLSGGEYRDPGFNPAWTGTAFSVTPKAQYAPRVGPEGIFYLDDRDADASGAMTGVWLHSPQPESYTTTSFFTPANAWDDVACPVPTVNGAAWLGPALAGGPFQPYMKSVGGTARVIGVLHDPGEIDSLWKSDEGPTPFTQLAVTGRHGATDRDYDVYFYDSIVRQMVPVCTLGSALPEDRDRLSQTQLAIGWGPPPASGVTWADARHNPPGTAYEDLTYKLYLAALPLVRISASRASLLLGKSVTFTAVVKPGMPGKSVKIQKGTKYTDTLYKITRYKNWTNLKTRTLSATSKATWTWTPARRGTYYIRANFAGAKVTDQTGAVNSWVPMPSKIIKIVVK